MADADGKDGAAGHQRFPVCERQAKTPRDLLEAAYVYRFEVGYEAVLECLAVIGEYFALHRQANIGVGQVVAGAVALQRVRG